MESRFVRVLRTRIEEEIEKQVENILTGAVQDYPSYRYGCGYCNGLRDALKLADELDTEMLRSGG